MREITGSEVPLVIPLSYLTSGNTSSQPSDDSSAAASVTKGA